MARKSKIELYHPKIKNAVDTAIRAGASVDRIVEIIESHGEQIGRSSAGRYKQKAEKAMERWVDAQKMADVWAEKIPENGDVSQLVRQILSAAAHVAGVNLVQGEDIEARELALLAKAAKDIALSAKADAEFQSRIREEARKEALEDAASEVETEARAQGMTDEQAEFWRRKVLGVA